MISPVSAQAAIAVSDLNRAKAFYGGTLGLTVREERADGVIYKAGDATFLVYPSQFAGTSQSTSMAFQVDDLDAAVKELNKAGVKLEEYDFPGLKTVNGIAEIEGMRNGWFKDPDGNILAIGQRS